MNVFPEISLSRLEIWLKIAQAKNYFLKPGKIVMIDLLIPRSFLVKTPFAMELEFRVIPQISQVLDCLLGELKTVSHSQLAQHLADVSCILGPSLAWTALSTVNQEPC